MNSKAQLPINLILLSSCIVILILAAGFVVAPNQQSLVGELETIYNDGNFTNGEKVCTKQLTLSEAYNKGMVPVEIVGIGKCTQAMLDSCDYMNCLYFDSTKPGVIVCKVFYSFPLTEHSDYINLDKLTCEEYQLVWRNN